MPSKINTSDLLTLEITCEKAKKICQVPCSYKLKKLCEFILDAFDFANDHLHQFYICQDGDPYAPDVKKISSTRDIGSVYPLPPTKQFFLLFDFGDDWIFEINNLSQTPPLDPQKHYPLVFQAKGKNPIQYPPCDD